MNERERLQIPITLEVLFVISGGRVADDGEDIEEKLGRKGDGE